MLKYISYSIGTPSKLVIFLHGYNGTIADHQYAIDWMCDKLQNALLIIPQAPEISDKNPQKNQWFGMIQYDESNKRSQPQTTIEEITDIYNLAADDVKRQSGLINNFISELQKKYQFDDSHTYLIGFSQGAMLTIYTALSRNQKIAGAFSLSGLVAGEKLLQQDIKSFPPLYLFHGEDDMKVQYKTLPYSIKWLQKHNITPQINTYPNLTHKICENEISTIAEIIG